MKKVFKMSDLSSVKVSKANCFLNGRQAFKVVVESSDDTGEVKYETLVAAKTYREAAETGFEAYLNY